MSEQSSGVTVVRNKPISLKLVAVALVTVFLFGILLNLTTVVAADVAVKKIVLNVSDANITVRKTYDNDFHYEYSDKYFKLAAAQIGDALRITISAQNSVTKIPLSERAVIYVPDREYASITVDAKSAGVSLPSINANYKVIGSNSAVGVELAKEFNKSVDLRLSGGAGEVKIDKTATNYTVNLASSASSIDLPDEFPQFLQQQNYQYKKGNGKTAINLDVKDSAFSLDLETIQSSKMESKMVGKAKYFNVTNEAQLRAIGSKDYPLSGNYTLKANISLDEDWVTIGASDDKPFTGIFDGNGYTISDVLIKDVRNPYKYVGFFGLVKGGTITNLTLEDVEIKTSNSRKDTVVANNTVAAKVVGGKVTGCKVIMDDAD